MLPFAYSAITSPLDHTSNIADASTDEDKASTLIQSVLVPLTSGLRSYSADEAGVVYDPRRVGSIPQTRGRLNHAFSQGNKSVVKDVIGANRKVILQESDLAGSFMARFKAGFRAETVPEVSYKQSVVQTPAGVRTKTVIIPASAPDKALNLAAMDGGRLKVAQPSILDAARAGKENILLRRAQQKAYKAGTQGEAAADFMRQSLPSQLRHRVAHIDDGVTSRLGGELRATSVTTTNKGRFTGKPKVPIGNQPASTRTRAPDSPKGSVKQVSKLTKVARALPLIGSVFDAFEVAEEISDHGLFSKGAAASILDLAVGFVPIAGVAADGIALATGQEGFFQALVGEGDD